MQWLNIILCVSGCLLSACGNQSFEPKILGSWTAVCSIDICTIITIAPDHTYSQRFEDSDSPYASGTWRVDRGRLAMRMLSTRVPDMKESIGKEQLFTISELQKDSFVVTSTEDQKTVLTWKRAH
jgi:hypothetical protein